MSTTPTTAPAAPQARTMGAVQPRTIWREHKRQRTYSITDTAFSINTHLATASGLNRSEVLEVVLRHALEVGLDLSALRTTYTSGPQPTTPPVPTY